MSLPDDSPRYGPGTNTSSFQSSAQTYTTGMGNAFSDGHFPTRPEMIEIRRNQYGDYKADKYKYEYREAMKARIEARKKAERAAVKFKTLRNSVVKEAAKLARKRTDSYKAEEATRKAKVALRKAAQLAKDAAEVAAKAVRNAAKPKTLRNLRMANKAAMARGEIGKARANATRKNLQLSNSLQRRIAKLMKK